MGRLCSGLHKGYLRIHIYRMELLIWRLLVAGQQLLQKHLDIEGTSIQSAKGMTLEEQNISLRRTVEAKEDELTELEQEIARLKTGKTGICLLYYCFPCFSFMFVLRHNIENTPLRNMNHKNRPYDLQENKLHVLQKKKKE